MFPASLMWPSWKAEIQCFRATGIFGYIQQQKRSNSFSKQIFLCFIAHCIHMLKQAVQLLCSWWLNAPWTTPAGVVSEWATGILDLVHRDVTPTPLPATPCTHDPFPLLQRMPVQAFPAYFHTIHIPLLLFPAPHCTMHAAPGSPSAPQAMPGVGAGSRQSAGEHEDSSCYWSRSDGGSNDKAGAQRLQLNSSWARGSSQAAS